MLVTHKDLLIVPCASALVGRGTIKEEAATHYDSYYAFQDEKKWRTFPTYYSYFSASPQYSKEGKVFYERRPFDIGYYCMRALSDVNPAPDSLYFFIKHKERTEITKKFYEFLFGPNSPWAKVFYGIALVFKTNEDIPDAVIMHDNTVDAKILVNLFTAIRLHTCWGLDYVFHRLLAAGFSEREAFLLSSLFQWNNQTITGSEDSFRHLKDMSSVTLTMNGCSKTDMPIMPEYNKSTFSNLFHRKTLRLTGKYSDGASIQPNNYLWHSDNKAINADNLDSWDKNKGPIRISGQDKFGLIGWIKGEKNLQKDVVKTIRDALLNGKEITL